MNIELSIVVPIYNVEQYLEKCLNSLYKLKIKKEIILVNDESPDNSYLIIEKYQKMFPKETIVINQKNMGLSGARNSGLKVATGEYIAFIDSDDFVDTDRYEEFFKQGKDDNLDIMIGNYYEYNKNLPLKLCKKDKKLSDFNVVDGKKFFNNSIKLKSFYEVIWINIYNRKFLLKNNLFFEVGLFHEDCLFTPQALSKAKRVKYFDIPFYYYRQREGSIMSTRNNKNIKDKIKIIEKLIDLNKEMRLDCLYKYLINIMWGIQKDGGDIDINLLKKIKAENINGGGYKIKDLIKITLLYLIGIKTKLKVRLK